MMMLMMTRGALVLAGPLLAAALLAGCQTSPASKPAPAPMRAIAAPAPAAAPQTPAALPAATVAAQSPPVTAADRPAQAREGRTSEDEAYLRANYQKHIFNIPMRDGVKLHTIVYTPKDAFAGSGQPFPIILFRTPYSIGPYGEDEYRNGLGPNMAFAREGYIFAYQDVRGAYMSEGEFVNMTPHVANKTSPHQTDESSDTWDAIDWLVRNIPNNNGRVGQWGISYPGFYTAAGMIDAHPALKAASPQAPIADWWYDDFHHHGALFLPHSFNFLAGFGRARPEPQPRRSGPRFSHGTPDGYQFFLDMGPLKNANEKHFKGEIAFWNDIAAHPNYDEFWQARNLLPHLHHVPPAVMTVGGWYDAEDLYGALNIYRATEAQNPGVFNMLVMGPWVHGGWNRSDGDRLGMARFGSKTSAFYREHIELPFFNYHLKGKAPASGSLDLPEAFMFETGSNEWNRFDAWPPKGIEEKSLYLQRGGKLSFDQPAAAGEAGGFDDFISDPAKPVPFTEAISTGMTREYMTDDQRFAARRPDVLAYQTDALEADLTLAGPVIADLWVATSGSDADWIVKLIDVFPPDADDPEDLPAGKRWGGYQMMVRSEVIRGRFRNSYEHPEPFTPNEPANVRLPLQDVLHTFQKGHRVMIQVQSTWFPLVDRNPQKYVDNIFEAEESDFIRATHRVYRAADRPSQIRIGVLPQDRQPTPVAVATELEPQINANERR